MIPRAFKFICFSIIPFKDKSLIYFVLCQEHGSGAADASQSEGHQSKLTARMASQTQTQKKTQVQLDHRGLSNHPVFLPAFIHPLNPGFYCFVFFCFRASRGNLVERTMSDPLVTTTSTLISGCVRWRAARIALRTAGRVTASRSQTCTSTSSRGRWPMMRRLMVSIPLCTRQVLCGDGEWK